MRDSVDHYPSLVELSPQVLWVMDRYGKVLDIFPGWDETIESVAKKAPGRGWLNSLHPQDLPTVLDAIEGRPLAEPRSILSIKRAESIEAGAGFNRGGQRVLTNRAWFDFGMAARKTLPN